MSLNKEGGPGGEGVSYEEYPPPSESGLPVSRGSLQSSRRAEFRERVLGRKNRWKENRLKRGC